MCCCFQSFKDLLAFYCHPFFERSAKVCAFLNSTKFILKIPEFIFYWTRCTFWRTSAFLKAEGKDMTTIFPGKLFCSILFTSRLHLQFIIKNLFPLFIFSFTNLFFPKAGRKDKPCSFASKYFLHLFCCHFWKALPIRISCQIFI